MGLSLAKSLGPGRAAAKALAAARRGLLPFLAFGPAGQQRGPGGAGRQRLLGGCCRRRDAASGGAVQGVKDELQRGALQGSDLRR